MGEWSGGHERGWLGKCRHLLELSLCAGDGRLDPGDHVLLHRPHLAVLALELRLCVFLRRGGGRKGHIGDWPAGKRRPVSGSEDRMGLRGGRHAHQARSERLELILEALDLAGDNREATGQEKSPAENLPACEEQRSSSADRALRHT